MWGIISFLALVVSLIFFYPVAVKLFSGDIVKEFGVAFGGALLISSNLSALGFIGFFYNKMFSLERAPSKLIMTTSILVFCFVVDYWYYENFYKTYSGTFFNTSLMLSTVFISYVIYDLFHKYYVLRDGGVCTPSGSKVLFVLAFVFVGATLFFKSSRFNLDNLRSGLVTTTSGQSIVLNSKFNDPKNPWLSVTLKPGRYSIEARGYIDVNINVNDPRRPEFDRVPPRGIRVSPISGQFPFPEFTNNNIRGCSLIVQPKGERTKAFEVDGYREFTTDTTIDLGFTINDDVLEDNGGEGWTIIITPLRNEGGHNSIVKNIKEMFGSSLPPEVQSRLRSLRQVGTGGVDGVVHWHPITSVEIDAGNQLLAFRYPFFEGVARGKLKGHTFSGVWRQSGGWGKFELKFSPDFSRADGWWARSDAPSRRHFLTVK